MSFAAHFSILCIDNPVYTTFETLSAMTPTLVKPPTLAAMPISSMWWKLQKAHAEVFRWSTYTRWNPRLPKQSNLAHINGILRLAEVLLRRLAAYHSGPDFRHDFLMLALLIHDDPEALLKRDVCYYKKTGQDDLDEFRIFAQTLENKPERNIVLRAFLLQFVTKDFAKVFKDEPEAMEILFDLKLNHMVEARLFNAFERMDYIEYAQMCWEICGDPVILTHVFRNQVKYLEVYGLQIPGFQANCWSAKHTRLAREFMEYFKGMPDPDENGSVEMAYEWAYNNGYMERPVFEDETAGVGGA